MPPRHTSYQYINATVYRYSGISAATLAGVTRRLADVQRDLSKILPRNAVLAGHSLENDLHALRLAHDRVIDTAICYQHASGPPYKPSLRWLATTYLSRAIQAGEHGHDRWVSDYLEILRCGRVAALVPRTTNGVGGKRNETRKGFHCCEGAHSPFRRLPLPPRIYAFLYPMPPCPYFVHTITRMHIHANAARRTRVQPWIW